MVNFVKSGNGSSSGSKDEKKHDCLPLRSLVPPAISPPAPIDLQLFEDPVWKMSTFHAYEISSNGKKIGSILDTPL